jgi:hypothetical protein
MTLKHQYKNANSLASNDTQGTQTLPETTKRRQKKNVNKRFQETANRNNDITDDTSRIRQGDLNKQTEPDFIREVKTFCNTK